MNLISGINVTGSALNAEQTRMDVIAQNIANAHTTRDVDGRAYQRKVVSFESFLPAGAQKPGPASEEVRVAGISADPTPGEKIYNPGDPAADKDGLVEMPNVNIATQMVDLVSASRAYEPNLAVVRNAKQMAAKALSIGH
jgi:flagellar basal-body rod protein FlgC